MLGAVGRLNYLRFDDAKIRSVLAEELKQMHLSAIGAWLKAVLTAVSGPTIQNDFPVWTGTAKSSLQPLGKYLEVRATNLPFDLQDLLSVTPVVKRKGMGPEVGRSQGQKFSIRTFSNQHGPFRFQFEWSTAVEHYAVNEFHNANAQGLKLKNPGPWNTMLAGNAAYREYLEAGLQNYKTKAFNLIGYTNA